MLTLSYVWLNSVIMWLNVMHSVAQHRSIDCVEKNFRLGGGGDWRGGAEGGGGWGCVEVCGRGKVEMGRGWVIGVRWPLVQPFWHNNHGENGVYGASYGAGYGADLTCAIARKCYNVDYGHIICFLPYKKKVAGKPPEYTKTITDNRNMPPSSFSYLSLPQLLRSTAKPPSF